MIKKAFFCTSKKSLLYRKVDFFINNFNCLSKKIKSVEKKQWITPQATEIEVNGGTDLGYQELDYGTIS
ncbi:hypothetical protein SAMN05192550_0556 [Flavobacterium glycines]|uniref:Uncharacterized protein n=1 Tax=Flavobacterium glycines TaxID=551990 RepID=A0A1B9DNW5_9FLAO|nr:hypothetical protein [Flavobacterium glycines]OCB71388.1 hypothetical protein FBGL_09085 [Flavobacterium glycines]GEL10408.1 hypothetical protein FGL01_11470 [Flavobacterium glycines]SDI69227.1 hypothetical protein SAMN05192550_0556 [Flavobacterium glycines]